MTRYQQTRQVILDLMDMLKDRPENIELWMLHIDLACDKIEEIYK